MRFSAAGFAFLVLAAPAMAQPAAKDDPQLETVIVTAPRIIVTPNAIAHDFIRSYSVPSVLLGTIARWRVAICPETRGMAPQFSTIVNKRIREIAAQVGAPVGTEGCRSNLWITFTATPQLLLDNIRAQNLLTLGYHGVTLVSHPIQAWYETGTTDIRGQTIVDQESWGLTTRPNKPPTFTGQVAQTGGWRGRTDLSSEFLGITVIVDTQKSGNYSVESVADYIAMMALSQTEAYDTCESVPSIANLLVPGCRNTPIAITDSDLAYLRGVYKMGAGASLQVQQNDIAAEMAKALPAN